MRNQILTYLKSLDLTEIDQPGQAAKGIVARYIDPTDEAYWFNVIEAATWIYGEQRKAGIIN